MGTCGALEEEFAQYEQSFFDRRTWLQEEAEACHYVPASACASLLLPVPVLLLLLLALPLTSFIPSHVTDRVVESMKMGNKRAEPADSLACDMKTEALTVFFQPHERLQVGKAEGPRVEMVGKQKKCNGFPSCVSLYHALILSPGPTAADYIDIWGVGRSSQPSKLARVLGEAFNT